MSAPHDARTALLGLRARVVHAAAALGRQDPLDLADLEAEASRLTAGIAALPHEQARPLLPDLMALLQDLERLESGLRQVMVEAASV